MAEALGNPAFDPHGDPIPDAERAVASELLPPLSDAMSGGRVEVRRVDTSEPDRLRYLGGIGLVPGAVLTIAGKAVPAPERRHRRASPRPRHDLAQVLLCARPPAQT
jgi:DtxR family Mn-dependent transcriptional regulator